MSADEFRSYVAEECRKAGGQLRYAESVNISQSYLSAFLKGRQDPGPSFCEAVGVEKIVEYRLKK